MRRERGAYGAPGREWREGEHQERRVVVRGRGFGWGAGRRPSAVPAARGQTRQSGAPAAAPRAPLLPMRSSTRHGSLAARGSRCGSSVGRRAAVRPARGACCGRSCPAASGLRRACLGWRRARASAGASSDSAPRRRSRTQWASPPRRVPVATYLTRPRPAVRKACQQLSTCRRSRPLAAHRWEWEAPCAR